MPSVRPRVPDCDFSGLKGKYKDPTSKMRFASAALFPYVQNMSSHDVSAYLRLRGITSLFK
jgi:hypothetical protein